MRGLGNADFMAVLEIKSKGFLLGLGSSWYVYTVKLTKQTLTYYDIETLKGTINTSNATTQIVGPQDADRREFAFYVVTAKGEKTLFNASSVSIRDRCLEAIKRSSLSPKWDTNLNSSKTTPANVANTASIGGEHAALTQVALAAPPANTQPLITGDHLADEDASALVSRALGRGSKPWRRSKLSIVGEGRAGKTALANAIIGRSFEETLSTVGINQLTCDVRHIQSTAAESDGISGGANQQWREYNATLGGELVNAVAEIVNSTRLQLARGERNSAAGGADVRSVLKNSTGRSPVHSPESLPLKYTDEGMDEGAVRLAEATKIATPTTETHVPEGPGVGTQSAPEMRSPHAGGTTTTVPHVAPLVTSPQRQLDEDMVMKVLATMKDAETGILVSLFDFGGQAMFDVIHHLFLTCYGVYAVVFNMEWLVDDADAEEKAAALCFLHRWLSSIAVHTYDESTGLTAPIVLVGTRMDRISSAAVHDQISTLLYNSFSDNLSWPSVLPNAAGRDRNGAAQQWFFPVANTSGADSPQMRHLMSIVHDCMDKALYTHKEVPLAWFTLMDRMHAAKCDSLTLSEVTALGAQCGVVTEEVPYFLAFLNDMGYLMWLDEPGLRDVVVLDAVKYLVTPATLVICNIRPDARESTHHHVTAHRECAQYHKDEWRTLKQDGILHVKLLPTLWKDCAASADSLLMLMVKFGLLVPLRPPARSGDQQPAEPSLYIVPALMQPAPTADPHVASWTDAPYLSMYFVFTLSAHKLQDNPAVLEQDLRSDGFLPNGMFERIVGKALSWSQDTSRGARLNLRGIVLYRNMAIMSFGRQRFRLVHCPSIHSIRVDIEGECPIGVQQKLAAIIDKIMSECMRFLRFFAAVPHRTCTETVGSCAEDPLHTSLLPTEVLIPLAQLRNASNGASMLTWRGGRALLSEESVRQDYAPWLQLQRLRPHYDAFISYRWGEFDSVFTEQLYETFTNYTVGANCRALEVFLDIRCLQKGQMFKEDFAAALTHSRVALPVVSVDALQRMRTHNAAVVDNVLLEWAIIQECFAAKRLHKVFPIVFGARVQSEHSRGGGVEVQDYFASGAVAALPHIVPTATLQRARELLAANEVQISSAFEEHTVNSIVGGLSEFLLFNAAGKTPALLAEQFAEEVLELLKHDVPQVTGTALDASMTAAAKGRSYLNNDPATANTADRKLLSAASTAEVCALVRALGFVELALVFEAKEVTGAMLGMCKKPENLQTKHFGVEEDFVAEGLFEYIQTWKEEGVTLG